MSLPLFCSRIHARPASGVPVLRVVELSDLIGFARCHPATNRYGCVVGGIQGLAIHTSEMMSRPSCVRSTERLFDGGLIHTSLPRHEWEAEKPGSVSGVSKLCGACVLEQGHTSAVLPLTLSSYPTRLRSTSPVRTDRINSLAWGRAPDRSAGMRQGWRRRDKGWPVHRVRRTTLYNRNHNRRHSARIS